jgi:hypothetical protein
MPFDLMESAWPNQETRRRFQRIRTTILENLIRLAGAEAVPKAMTQDRSSELSGEGRRRLLVETLDELNGSLAQLAGLIDQTPPNIPADLGGPQALKRMVVTATASVKEQLEVVRMVGPVNVDQLESIPGATQPALSDLINTWCPVRKIFVAVHGIGDQFQSDTVQSVAYRVCDYVGVPAALPLGRIHGPGGTVTRAFIPDPDRDPPIACGFAEIYWANAPRIPAADKHILENPKKWARTLVERLRLRDAEAAARSGGAVAEWAQKSREDDQRLEQIIGELIQGVIVTNRLSFLAEKAGLFKFDLKQLLDDYLNDVQVVTEFEDCRRQVLEIFDDVLEKIHRYLASSDIYIIAHSEGTVVSFMGLLKGLSDRAPWAGSIRGYMTIGSPLNKHVFFWPELFTIYDSEKADPDYHPIPWKNYYDYGDPIAYNLKQTRDWMRETKWYRFFTFRDDKGEDDIGFTRYYFPGAAHNDYWRDRDVFGHFIQQVVDRTSSVLAPAKQLRYEVPGTKVLACLTSYPMPYFMSAALLFLACYLLYKSVRGCLDPIGARFETPTQIVENVLGLFGLIAGMSFLARIPSLARATGWRIFAFALAVPFSYLYLRRVSPGNRGSIERFVSQQTGSDPFFNNYNQCLLWALAVGVLLALVVKGLRPVLRALLPILLLVLALRVANAVVSGVVPATGLLDTPVIGPWVTAIPWPSLEIISLAWLIGIMAWHVSWVYPEVGTKPLIHTAGLLISMIIVTQFVGDQSRLSSAGLAFQGLEDSGRATLVTPVNEKVARRFPQLANVTQPAPANPAAHDQTRELAADQEVAARAAQFQAVAEAALEQGPIWPVFLAGAAFLYIWWLAILLFDLTFVWHLYIRWPGAENYVQKRRGQTPRARAMTAN